MKVEEIMTVNPDTIDQETNVSLAMNRMRSGKIAQLPVESRGKYAGMISYRDLIRKKSIHLNSKIKNYAVNVPELKKDDTIEDALNLIKESATGALPVVEKEKIIGLVSRTDIIGKIDEFPEVSKLKVFEIMSEAYSANENDDIEVVMEKIRDHDTDLIPIANNENRVIGLVRANKILEFQMKDKGRDSNSYIRGEKERFDIDVISIMEDPVICYEDDDVAAAALLMVKEHMHSLAVCDKGQRISGILSMDDVINTLGESSSTEGMLVNVSGLGSGDSDIYGIIFAMTEKFTERFSRVANLKKGSFSVHVVKHKSEEGRIKYSVRTRLLARKVNMTASYSGWNFGKVMSEIFDSYEKRSRKELNKD